MEAPATEVKQLGHLGIIAAIFKEYKIIEKIDLLLQKTSNHKTISHGEAVFAMVLQGLGFSNSRVYLSKEFLSHVEIIDLFGREIPYEYFNSTALGRTLDAIYKYGSTQFYTDTCLSVVIPLIKRFVHVDTSSFYVTGKKYKNKGDFKLAYGYSKDNRADLKQLVYLLVTTEDGLPLMHEVHSGNASDGTVFEEICMSLQKKLDEDLKNRFIVFDSSIYNKEFIQNDSISKNWITRVPESIKQCKELLSKERNDWIKIDKDYKYAEITAKYGGLEQRWIIVRNRESKYKELETLNKKLKKEEENFDDAFKKLKKRTFLGKTEASEYMAMKRKSHPLFKFEYSLVGVYKKIPRSKRKIKVGVRIHAKAIRNEEKIKKLENRKGKFVLATPFMDDKELSAEDILNSYRGRNKAIEGNFKVLKDRTKNLNQICLKKEERIEAMMAVMTLILMVNNLAQIKLRDHLVEHEETVPNQLGRSISNPTFAWASYILRHIVKLKIKIGDQIFHEVQGLKREFECIIKAFGSYAKSIYGLD